MAEAITVFYGAATHDGAQAVELRPGAPLRLSDGPYPFAEPPDLIRLDTTAARLGFLCEHLQSFCDLWAKPPRQFLDVYFVWIAATLAADPAQRALTELGHGLFAPADWSFMAPRPLPSTLLTVAGDTIRTDFAFWTGEGFIAIELPGERRAKRRAELARLRATDVVVVELATADLGNVAALGTRLPPPFRDFWRGASLPLSPFGGRDLAITPVR